MTYWYLCQITFTVYVYLLDKAVKQVTTVEVCASAFESVKLLYIFKENSGQIPQEFLVTDASVLSQLACSHDCKRKRGWIAKGVV